MTNAPPSGIVAVAVEGTIDEAVVRRLVRLFNGSISAVYGGGGKKDLLKKLAGYNNSARFSPWFVLIDLDQDAACAAEFRQKVLSEPAPHMCFRIAVREVESWLLADQIRMAQFLGISAAQIPSDVDQLPDPKQKLIALAGKSPRTSLKKDLIPRPGSGRSIGAGYSSRIIEFIADEQTGWRPEVAAHSSDSLMRCLYRLEHFLKDG